MKSILKISMHSAKAVYIPTSNLYASFLTVYSCEIPLSHRLFSERTGIHSSTCGFSRVERLSESLRLVLATYCPHTITLNNDLRTDKQTQANLFLEVYKSLGPGQFHLLVSVSLNSQGGESIFSLSIKTP
jgi:hypothetical protein